ncbi:MAG: elongation factor P [Parcubacteria group bacterium]|nr:elongation factor P [Parcubacteria group bacterium]
MIDHTQLRKGVQIVLDGAPYEILESAPMKKAQRRVVIQARLRNLLTGNMLDRNFHQGDTFEEADLVKKNVLFLYGRRGKYMFCEKENRGNRFELEESSLGEAAHFLKQDQELTAVEFEGKIVNVILPIKVQLKVAEAPPGVKGDRAQGGTKSVTLETGTIIQAPLFIETGDSVEINTDKGEYVRRV